MEARNGADNGMSGHGRGVAVPVSIGQVPPSVVGCNLSQWIAALPQLQQNEQFGARRHQAPPIVLPMCLVDLPSCLADIRGACVRHGACPRTLSMAIS